MSRVNAYLKKRLSPLIPGNFSGLCNQSLQDLDSSSGTNEDLQTTVSALHRNRIPKSTARQATGLGVSNMARVSVLAVATLFRFLIEAGSFRVQIIHSSEFLMNQSNESQYFSQSGLVVHKTR